MSFKKELPPYNIGKTRTIIDIHGKKQQFTIVNEVQLRASENLEKFFVLQELRAPKDGRGYYKIIRICYYIIGKKPGSRGRWVWGQFAPMILKKDLMRLIEKAKEAHIL